MLSHLICHLRGYPCGFARRFAAVFKSGAFHLGWRPPKDVKKATLLQLTLALASDHAAHYRLTSIPSTARSR